MPTHAAFLRAINLGSRRRVSGAELRSLFEGMGLGDVATFRTSGNVVFSSPGEGSPSAPAARIEEGLAASLGYDVGVFLRSASEVLAIASQQPFPAELVEASKGKLQVMLLSSQPASDVREELLGHATDDDRLAFGEREVYWLPRGGISESELDSKAITRLLGPTTTRTMGTIEQLAAKFFAA